MSFDLTMRMDVGAVRPFALVGPVGGMFVLFRAGIQQQRIRADSEEINRLLVGLADRCTDEKEVPE